MIAGSHSSTMDRLYAWERKLYDEVKVHFILHGLFMRDLLVLRFSYVNTFLISSLLHLFLPF